MSGVYSRRLRAYCEQNPSSGSRRFLVASDASLWAYLLRLPPTNRHIYEASKA